MISITVSDLFTHSQFSGTAGKPWENIKSNSTQRKNKKAAIRIQNTSCDFFNKILSVAKSPSVISSVSDILRGSTPEGWAIEENRLLMRDCQIGTPRVIYFSESPELACQEIEKFSMKISPIEEITKQPKYIPQPEVEITWDLIRRKKFMRQYIGKFVFRESKARDLNWEQQKRLTTLCYIVFSTKTVTESKVTLHPVEGILSVSLIRFDNNSNNYLLCNIPTKRKVQRRKKEKLGEEKEWKKFVGGGKWKQWSPFYQGL
jgi:hypothetical protein